MQNIRVNIGDLVAAAKVLGEVKIVAAGSIWATLECDGDMCLQLAKHKISWWMD